MTERVVVETAGEDGLARMLAMDPRVRDVPGRRVFLERAAAAGEAFVARIGGEAAGFAVFDRSFFEQPFMSLLYVEPDMRRRGIARALVTHIEARCSEGKLFTSTNESNVVMQQVCAALGFVGSGRIENLDEGDPELVYVRRLPGPRPTENRQQTTDD